MISFPNAKINLGLNIVSKRGDGYHNIESCFYPIPWHDCLEVIEAASFTFQSYGLSIPGGASSNLCVKAYELLKADFDIPPVEIHLLKNIPMGAGLGGGSADGAFTLIMLNELFALGVSDLQLENYALQLGSDCPFFIKNHPAIAKSRGEELMSIDLKLSGHYLAIHNPDIHISTKEAYVGVSPKQSDLSVTEIIKRPIREWKDTLKNDFEDSIFPNHPKVEQLKNEMYEAGATYASMTGSGSTVFGLFEVAPENSNWKLIKL
ncbi:4-diphosphocytidyl-2-C-methyl-D-erythritol kinase [Ekhidna lutea]|uniref:4-diphosphocytidyl-2-C-methyl-D-erythritol kinase n=1 Tax=Ekhidna lutea TaxID=447679 RepID=A0A239M6G4_EKHLU|nr:4-(cytidine 5'-diphospho)-2-C-methyl-D-erythritol kinase [Ekhidna lutea]SNT37738.1 4-diphosphocytidyl-2-C-methyl-D-erythritol kinase [Ekhidna lutea]